MKNYNVDYFIKKFEAIPEALWNNFSQYDSETNTFCAFGHCRTRILHCGNTDGADSMEGRSLIEMFNSAGFDVHSGNWITDVNNGRSFNYQQPTPKQRILAALYDIKKMQQPVYEDITTSLAVLPVSETSDLVNKVQPT